jgi:hypothetical protein
VVGLIGILVGNAPTVQEATFFGASVGTTSSNLGFAILLIGSFQWVYDNLVREKFFADIRAEVGAAESVRDAGVLEICSDSRTLDYTIQASTSRNIEVGVAYSDRFFKDYTNCLKSRKDLRIDVYHSDAADEELIRCLSYMTNKTIDDIRSSAGQLQAILNELQASGVDIRRYPSRSISHYSFLRFDNAETFFVASTFSSRRANVPSFQIAPNSALWRFVDDDIQEVKKCQTNLDASSTPWLKSLVKKLFSKS